MSFIPQSAKEFPHKEGDLLMAFEEETSNFSIIKIIKVEKITMNKGDVRNILGQQIQAPEDDFFLVVSWKTTDKIYRSIEDAKNAASDPGKIVWKIGHIPSRPGALTQKPKENIGYQEVTNNELAIHNEWKNLFDKGEAGVF